MIYQFLRNEDGASAIEYGLIAGLIAVVIISATTEVGTKLKAVFEDIRDSLPGGSSS